MSFAEFYGSLDYGSLYRSMQLDVMKFFNRKVEFSGLRGDELLVGGSLLWRLLRARGMIDFWPVCEGLPPSPQ